MAVRWITAFVEPPMAHSATVAFSQCLGRYLERRSEFLSNQFDAATSDAARDLEVARVPGGNGRRTGPGQSECFGKPPHGRCGAHGVARALAQRQRGLQLGPLVIG